MNAIIIFDVSTRMADVKEQMSLLGYFVRWKADEVVYILPSSVVWKPNIELKAAL